MTTNHYSNLDSSVETATLAQSLADGSRLETTKEPRPLAVSIKEFCRLCSIGRTTAWTLAREKRVEVRRIKGKTLVLMRSIEALLEVDGARK